MSKDSKRLPLASIRLDGGTQARVHLNQDAVDEYAEILGLEDGPGLPPVDVFFDGSDYWMADGFTRYFAQQKRGEQYLDAIIHTGTQRDAILFAMGANASHGQRRTNDDKRKAVETLLNDAEWSKWSNREIARRVGVSDIFVGNVRSKLTANACSETPAERKFTSKHGTESTMDTANIGKTKPKIPGGINFDPSEWPSGEETNEAEVDIPAVHSGPMDDSKIKLLTKPFAQASTALNNVYNEFASAVNEEPLLSAYLGENRLQELDVKIGNVKNFMSYHKPEMVCGKCKGTGCSSCEQTGYLPRHKKASHVSEK